MTERFTIDEHSDVNKIDDNLEGEFYLIANGFDTDRLCELLNTLYEEKEDWKHKVGQLLFILKQFDEEKVKQLIEDLE